MGVTVLKVGGAALARGGFRLERHIAPGEAVVVVHGAGDRIGAALAAAGIPSCFHEGRRVTPPEALPHVRAAFAATNAALCAAIGERAVGLLGDEIGLRADAVAGLGRAGLLRPYAPAVLGDLVAAGRIPVLAPLARGPLNVNADDAAAALAQALGAERLVFVSDVEGVVVAGEVASQLGVAQVDDARRRGDLSGGILPKLDAALAAATAGIETRIGSTLVTAGDTATA
jgi:acetylglutamate kinase